MISVRASASGQSGEQAVAGLDQQTTAPSPNSSVQMSAAEGCLRFINHAWTQFHAVGESRAGYVARSHLHSCPPHPNHFRENVLVAPDTKCAV